MKKDVSMVLYRYEDKSARDSDVSANVNKKSNKNPIE